MNRKEENRKRTDSKTLGAVTHKYNLKDNEDENIIKLGGTIMDGNNSIRKKQEYRKQRYSKKYAKKLKKKLQVSMFSIVMVLLLIAGGKLAGICMPINRLEEDISQHVIKENKTLVNDKEGTLLTGDNYISDNESDMLLRNNDLQNNGITALSENSDTVTYIYTADDLVKFRDSVNVGNAYTGKTVYLMNDIDLSTVCSSLLGSWEPINKFAGTFDGNYHTISNLYINSNLYADAGLFSIAMENAIIRNLVLDNVYVYNNYSSNGRIGVVSTCNFGKIINCGIESGNIISTTTIYTAVGGISGYVSGNTAGIYNCYNKANISANLTSGDYIRVGGICGEVWNEASIVNCYNMGNITSSGQRRTQNGGVVGAMYINPQVTNCYNIGTVSGRANVNVFLGGIIGNSGESINYLGGTISNSYCTTSSCGISYYYYSGGMKTSTTGRVAPETLQTYTVYLSSAYAYDVYNKNEGYPVLAWQNETQVIELNQKQAYIKTGENLQLEINSTVGARRTVPTTRECFNY